MTQYGKLVSQDSGRSSFYLLHDSSRGLLRPALQKEVDVVVMALHRKDFDIEFLAGLLREFFETIFHMRDVENLAPIPRAKDEMVVDEGDGGSRPKVFVHASIILYCICFCNRQTQKGKGDAAYPTIEIMGLRRAVFYQKNAFPHVSSACLLISIR